VNNINFNVTYSVTKLRKQCRPALVFQIFKLGSIIYALSMILTVNIVTLSCNCMVRKLTTWVEVSSDDDDLSINMNDEYNYIR
jgi:hypothetical protein